MSTQEGDPGAPNLDGGDPASPDSVAAVLAMTWAGDAEEMYRYLTGEVDRERLDYEDWTGPMGASAGRICLRVGADSEEGPRWIRRTPDGFDCCVPEDGDLEFRSTWRGEIEQWLEAYGAEPVLVEETPFARPGTEVSA